MGITQGQLPPGNNSGSSSGLHTPPGGGTLPSGAPRQVKFESALDFLDQVKLQFSEQPKVCILLSFCS